MMSTDMLRKLSRREFDPPQTIAKRAARLDDETRAQIIELCRQGMSCRAISERLGVNRNTIAHYAIAERERRKCLKLA